MSSPNFKSASRYIPRNLVVFCFVLIGYTDANLRTFEANISGFFGTKVRQIGFTPVLLSVYIILCNILYHRQLR